MTKEEIISELKITEPIVCIYPYGSHNYGTNRPNSDRDFILVSKGALLSSGAFKNNAISNSDRTIQGVVYSRSGFRDAINNYDIAALECLSLENPILSSFPFKIEKWDNKEMARKIIQKISASWHSADLAAKDGNIDYAKKGIFHAFRILEFALQLKEHRKIVDFNCIDLYNIIHLAPRVAFDTRKYIKLRDSLMEKLRS